MSILRLGRLPASLFIFALASACGRSEPAPVVSRYDAVQATATPASAPIWCDASFASGGPKLELPRVEAARPAGTAPALAGQRPVWVNIWATWCIPCQREMPLLLRWRDAMRRDGIDVEMIFLSVDDQATDLTKFLAEHPEMAPDPSGRLLSSADLDPWLARYVKPVPSGIPVQLLAGADGSLRCIRSGSLRDGDYPTVTALLR